MSTRRGTDRGEATTQLVVLVPVLMLAIWLAVQAAIFFHAANVAAAAAARGAAAGAPAHAPPGSAVTAAHLAAVEMGGVLVATPTVVRSSDLVRVDVVVRVPRIVPFFPTSVRRQVVEPREEHLPEDRR